MKRIFSQRTSTWLSLLSATVMTLLVVTVGRAEFMDGLPLGDGSVRFRTNFDAVLAMSDDGRRVFASGITGCTEGEKVQIYVTVTQRSTGATAEGNWKGECTGEPQTWGTDAITRGSTVFEPGTALAGGLGATLSRGKTTDAIQWLEEVSLVPQ